MRLVVLVVAAAICVGTPAAAGPRVGHLTASRDGWHADLSFLKGRGSFPLASHFHLVVRADKRLVLDAPVTSSLRGVGNEFQPLTLSFRDLNEDGSKELVLSLFTGGAHCCTFDQVFDFSGVKPRKTEFDFADSGATIEVLGGKVVFATRDDSFGYVFTDFADSGFPIAFHAYDRGRFTDVTRDYPALVARDAAYWWKQYRARLQPRDDVRGILSAWAADESLLGHATAAKQRLARIAANGALAYGFGPPKGRTYLRQLWRFLAQAGYLH